MAFQDFLDQGVSKVRSTVSEVSVEQRSFVKAFVRLCSDGWQQGWHERNGGNASYRMNGEEVSNCRSCFNDASSSWVSLGVCAPALAGEFFLVTGAGSFMRNIPVDVAGNIGIVEIDGTGSAYRVVWGLTKCARPTSEFASHFMIHAVAMSENLPVRVLYHCHPVDVVAMSLVLPPDPKEVSRALWKSMTECVMVFPEGVGVAPVLTPGSMALADCTATFMKDHRAVVWAGHGLFVSGATFDEAFGLAHVVAKAASIFCTVRSMSGNTEPSYPITDDKVRAIAKDLGVDVREAYLD